MATAEAAGYAMAPPMEEVPPVARQHLEAEFRNGHRSAATKTHLSAKIAMPKLAPSRALVLQPATSWLHAALASFRPRRAAI